MFTNKATRAGTKVYVGAGFLFGVWMLGVGALALSPTEPLSGAGDVTHYRVYTSTTMAYQDASGKFTVHLCDTRPVVSAKSIGAPL